MTQKTYYRFASVLLALTLALTMFGPALATPPSNDDFGSATSIASLPFSDSIDTSEAMAAVDDPITCTNIGSVWYAFTPGTDMNITADTFGSNYDTVLSVYTGTQGALTQVPDACNDDFTGLQSKVEFNATAGTTYFFLIGVCCGVGGGGGGSLTFSVHQLLPPENDNFSDLEVIDSLPFNDSLDNTGATRETDEPYDCYGSSYTVWYSFQAQRDGLIRADMSGSSFSDTQLSVYTATSPGFSGLNFVQCGYFGNPITLSVQAGTTYYFQAGSVVQGRGDLHINLLELLPPQNDNFADATSISTLPFTEGFDNGGATFETDEPPTCGYPAPPYKTLWFAFTPAQDESISASLPTLTFGGYIAAYTGTDLGNLVNLGCSQYSSRFTFRAVAGQTYYFQVGGIYGESGLGTFLLETAPPPQVGFYFNPGDPSKYDPIQFCSSSFDPGNVGFQSFTWDYGDGTTATDGCASHLYSSDGDYVVQHSATTYDGRTATSTPQTVQVRTHDVAITRITAPNSANSGQTKTITATLRNYAYPEMVYLNLYRSTPNGGFEWVATLTRSVPVLSGNRTTSVSFSYTFTSADAMIGKVSFKVIATLIDAHDALPVDNEAISSPPTKVGR